MAPLIDYACVIDGRRHVGAGRIVRLEVTPSGLWVTLEGADPMPLPLLPEPERETRLRAAIAASWEANRGLYERLARR